MENVNLDEGLIREYLLGRLQNNEELEARMDEQALTDANFSEAIAVVEDEIVEDYLDGTLSDGDRAACEQHFLRPPERKQKLRQAQLLNRHLAGTSFDSGPARAAAIAKTPPPRTARVLQFPRLRTSAEIAAAIIFAVSLGYFIRVHGELRAQLSRNSQELAEERQRNGQMDRQLQAALGSDGAPTATLNLLEPGTFRGAARLPELKVGAMAGMIHTEVALPAGASGAFTVQILCAGNMVWSHGPIGSRAVPGGAILAFDFPGQAPRAGDCRIALRHVSDSEITYRFAVSKGQ